MKRLIIALIIFLIIITFSLCSSELITNYIESLDQQLDNTIQLLDIKSNEATIYFDKIYENWVNKEIVISLIVEKDYCKALTAELSSALFNIKTDNVKIAIQKIQNSKTIIKEISDSQTIMINEFM